MVEAIKEITVQDLLKPPQQFTTGNDAVVYGALLAGCKFFAGYPITPATEIAEKMSEFLPLLDGMFLQMEDEIAAIAAIIGASWNGIRTLTATSGPGFSLMQENLGYACMTETPIVIVDVQRSGPSTGQPTKPSQGDVMQARWGTHGDHSIIVLAPNSVQECLEVTIRAFNLADKFRTPVIILSDAILAHMREKLIIPSPDQVEIVGRVPVTIEKAEYHPFRTGYTRPGSKVPEMDRLGDEYYTHLTGLTHDWKAFPQTTDPKVHEMLVKRFYEKISDHREDIVKYETQHLEDEPNSIIVSYGITSRPALEAVEMARSKGMDVGFLRLITIWPFANEIIFELSQKTKRMIVPEMNLGQVYHKVAEYSCGNCEVVRFGKIGGELHTPEEIFEKVRGGGV